MSNTKIKAYLFNNAFYVVLLFLGVSFLFDFIDKGYNIKLNRALKVCFITYAALFNVFHLKYIFKKTIYVPLLLGVTGILFLFKYGFWHLYTHEYLKYLFLIISLPLLHFAFSEYTLQKEKYLYKFFTYFIAINAVLILFGFLFQIKMTETYFGSRLGYNGLILSQGMTPYIYLSALTLFWLKKNKPLLILCGILIFISGVKGAYLAGFLFLIIAIMLSNKLSKNIKLKVILGVGIVFIVLIAAFFSTPQFNSIIENNGILSAVFSYRLDYFGFMMQTKSASDLSWWVGATGMCPFNAEMQFIDILLFFGTIGLLAYFIFLFILYKKYVNTNVSVAFFVTTMIVAAAIGNLFYNPIASTLFVVTLFFIDSKNRYENPS